MIKINQYLQTMKINVGFGSIFLFILVFQNLLYILCMRHARSRNVEKFIPSSMVIMSECIKLITSLFLLKVNHEVDNSIQVILRNPSDFLLTFIPALIYIVQNRLLIGALGHLDAVTFQVAYQLKLLTTALFSMLILHKPISRMQWVALILLFFGVAFVETPGSTDQSIKINSAQNPTLGIFCVICAAVLSGFASVSFELLLKRSSKSLWLRNAELAFASIITGVPTQFISDWSDISSKGYFCGFDYFVWFIICLHSFGGLLVALIVKYANNILKAFACSISIVLSCIWSIIFLGFEISSTFFMGTVFVLIASILYAMYPPKLHTN